MTDPSPHPQRSRGLLVLVFVQFCYGMFPVFGKWAFEAEAFAPYAVAAWRIAAAALVLGALAFLIHGREAIPRRQDLPRFALCALTGVVLNQGLFLEGLKLSSATNAGLVMSTIPVFTYALAMIVRLESWSARRVLGIVIALAGSVPFLVGTKLGSDYALGNALLMINALSYSVYLVISKPLTRSYPPLVIIAWVFMLSLFALPAFVFRGPMIPDSAVLSSEALQQAWLSLAYILVFPTVLAYSLNTYALVRVQASTTAVFVFLQPVIAVLGAFFLLGEALVEGTLWAAALLFTGLGLVIWRPTRK